MAPKPPRPGFHSIAMPRREFVNGVVHFEGPFEREGIPLTLCGASGMNRRQLRVRAPLNCPACDSLARWVWSHRRPYGYGEVRAAKNSKKDPPAQKI